MYYICVDTGLCHLNKKLYVRCRYSIGKYLSYYMVTSGDIFIYCRLLLFGFSDKKDYPRNTHVHSEPKEYT